MSDNVVNLSDVVPDFQECRAPKHKYRVFLTNSTERDKFNLESTDYHMLGDFDSMVEAVAKCKNPPAGASWVVYDDTGAIMHSVTSPKEEVPSESTLLTEYERAVVDMDYTEWLRAAGIPLQPVGMRIAIYWKEGDSSHRAIAEINQMHFNDSATVTLGLSCGPAPGMFSEVVFGYGSYGDWFAKRHLGIMGEFEHQRKVKRKEVTEEMMDYSFPQVQVEFLT